MLHSFDIATHFDALVISSEVGYLKPRKEIFEVALSSLSVRPGDVLHVGDNFRADIVRCGLGRDERRALYRALAQIRPPCDRRRAHTGRVQDGTAVRC